MTITRYDKVNPGRDTIPTKQSERSRIIKRDRESEGNKGKQYRKKQESEVEHHPLPEDEIDLHEDASSVVLNDIQALLRDLIRQREEQIRQEEEERIKGSNAVDEQESDNQSDKEEEAPAIYSEAAHAYESHVYDGADLVETSDRTDDDSFRDRTGFLNQPLEALNRFHNTVEKLKAIGQENISVVPGQLYADRLEQLYKALRRREDSEEETDTSS